MEIDLVSLARDMRSFLKTFNPEDPVQAIAYLEVLSALKEEKEEKRLKAASYEVLDNAVPDGKFEFAGITINKVLQTKTVFNRTGEVIQAEANLKVAKEALDKAQREAGFETVPGNKYWQIEKTVPAA